MHVHVLLGRRKNPQNHHLGARWHIPCGGVPLFFSCMQYTLGIVAPSLCLSTCIPQPTVPLQSQRIKGGQINPLPSGVSEGCRTLLMRLLEVDPGKRYKVEDLCQVCRVVLSSGAEQWWRVVVLVAQQVEAPLR